MSDETTPLRLGAWSRHAMVALVLALAGLALLGVPSSAAAAGLSTSTCHLAGPYQHVVYIQFDNQHLSRDNPNVPSDLE